MKAWQVVNDFGLLNLKVSDVHLRPLKSNEVRVKIRACSLNYRDLLVVKGLYNPRQTLPFIPVSDGAGEVIEIGSEVKHFKLYDRVCATFSQCWDNGRVGEEAQRATLGSPLPGMLAEEGIFNERGLVLMPPSLSFLQASTLPCAAVTAFNALTHEADLKPGDTVLLEGSGGVSVFALQFAKVLGLKTIMLSSSLQKINSLLELGADHVINYKSIEDWPSKVMELTGNYGVDAVLDVGGPDTLRKALRSLKKGGTALIIGILSGTKAELEITPILMRQLKLIGVFVGSKAVFLSMNRVIEHSNIKPVINKVFSFDDAKEAFDYLSSEQHLGKVCIEIQ